MITIMDEKYFGVEEIAEMLKLSTQTIRKYIKIGQFKAIKMGKFLYVKETDINEFLSKVISQWNFPCCFFIYYIYILAQNYLEDIQKVATTYHNWKMGEGTYEDIAGFCKVATLEEVKSLNYVVTPGRYVGLPDEEDDFVFAERFGTLKAELEKQIAEEYELNKRILNNLKKINQ